MSGCDGAAPLPSGGEAADSRNASNSSRSESLGSDASDGAPAPLFRLTGEEMAANSEEATVERKRRGRPPLPTDPEAREAAREASAAKRRRREAATAAPEVVLPPRGAIGRTCTWGVDLAFARIGWAPLTDGERDEGREAFEAVHEAYAGEILRRYAPLVALVGWSLGVSVPRALAAKEKRELEASAKGAAPVSSAVAPVA